MDDETDDIDMSAVELEELLGDAPMARKEGAKATSPAQSAVTESYGEEEGGAFELGAWV